MPLTIERSFSWKIPDQIDPNSTLDFAQAGYWSAPTCFSYLPFAPTEGYTCRRLAPRGCVGKECRYRASTNINTEAHRTHKVQELNTAAVIHGEEGVAAVHSFGGNRIRHHSARCVDHTASALNEYRWGIRDVRGETTGSDGQIWDSTFVVKGPFTEVVREVRIIEKAAHCGLTHA